MEEKIMRKFIGLGFLPDTDFLYEELILEQRHGHHIRTVYVIGKMFREDDEPEEFYCDKTVMRMTNGDPQYLSVKTFNTTDLADLYEWVKMELGYINELVYDKEKKHEVQ